MKKTKDKKVVKKEKPVLPTGMWVFVQVKYESEDTIEELAEEELKANRVYAMFADVPVEAGCLVIRMDLGKPRNLASIQSAYVCASYGVVKSGGEPILKKDGSKLKGYRCVDPKKFEFSPKAIARLAKRK